MNTSHVFLSRSENFVVSSNVSETSVSVLVMEQWKVYVCVWLESGSENEIKCGPSLTLTRGFLPAGAKQVTHCNVVNILQICNSSLSLMCSNRRERKNLLVGGKCHVCGAWLPHAGQHMVSEESFSCKGWYWLCDLYRFSGYERHFPAQLEKQDREKKWIKSFMHTEASLFKNW